MVEERIKQLTDEYLDGELDEEAENNFFSILSVNKEAKEYFKEMNKLKLLVSQSLENYPDKLDEKILKTPSARSTSERYYMNFHNVVKVGVYALLLILSFTGYSLFENLKSQSDQLAAAREAVKHQKEIIEVITSNQLMPVTVESELNSIIIQADQ